jgi:hypothetical protein
LGHSDAFSQNAREHWEQGDQKIGIEFAQILDKVAKTVAKSENAKISSSKLNLDVQNIYI